MNLKYLEYSEFENTNITMDAMKLLRCRPMYYPCHFGIGVTKQQFFNYGALFKQMARVQQISHLNTKITGTFIFKYDTFLYWGLLSKLVGN